MIRARLGIRHRGGSRRIFLLIFSLLDAPRSLVSVDSRPGTFPWKPICWLSRWTIISGRPRSNKHRAPGVPPRRTAYECARCKRYAAYLSRDIGRCGGGGGKGRVFIRTYISTMIVAVESRESVTVDNVRNNKIKKKYLRHILLSALR